MINFNPATGYYTWVKGTAVKLSDHFETEEFTCACLHPECKEQKVLGAFLDRLESLRRDLGSPLRVSSGYRCSNHQADLRSQGFETATGTSQHELGNAADISSPTLNGKQLESWAARHFDAIGTAARWVHVDGRSDKVRRWEYK